MTWRVAKSLDQLLHQINEKYPSRDKSSDGSIGNAEHASRSSDHNPWVTDGPMGIVTARDFTHDPQHGFDSYAFAEHLRHIRDPRIKYVISNHRIFGDEGYAARNRATPWGWAPYGGPNPHDHHVHVSVDADKPHFDLATPWDIGEGVSVPAPGPVVAVRPTLKLGASGPDVAYLQRMLGIPATSAFDAKTEQSVMEFQKRFGLVVDGRVGTYTWRQLEA